MRFEYLTFIYTYYLNFEALCSWVKNLVRFRKYAWTKVNMCFLSQFKFCAKSIHNYPTLEILKIGKCWTLRKIGARKNHKYGTIIESPKLVLGNWYLCRARYTICITPSHYNHSFKFQWLWFGIAYTNAIHQVSNSWWCYKKEW